MMISVCIPTYRGAKRLGRLLPTLAGAADPDMELLILDDGSPTEEAAEIEALVDGFEGAKYISTQNNGTVAAQDQLIKQSTGEIVLLLDDDVLIPSDLFLVLRQLISIERIGALSWRSTGVKTGQSKNPRIGFLQPATQIASYCMSFRRKVYDKVGGIDTRFRQYCGDSDLALRMTIAGHPSYRVWWPLVPHEQHGAFNDAPELGSRREQIASEDLRTFFNKWAATGDEMEKRAISGLERT